MDKNPCHQKLVFLNGTKSFQKGREYVKANKLPVCPVMIKTVENQKCGGSCEKRSSLTHQSNSKGVEYGQGMCRTNFENKYEHNKVCVKMIPKNPSTDLLLYS